MTQRGFVTITPSELRVLEAVFACYSTGGRAVTIRDVVLRLGWRSTNHAWIVLRKLRHAGLISQSPGQDRTIVPACRFTPER